MTCDPQDAIIAYLVSMYQQEHDRAEAYRMLTEQMAAELEQLTQKEALQ